MKEISKSRKKTVDRSRTPRVTSGQGVLAPLLPTIDKPIRMKDEVKQDNGQFSLPVMTVESAIENLRNQFILGTPSQKWLQDNFDMLCPNYTETKRSEDLVNTTFGRMIRYDPELMYFCLRPETKLTLQTRLTAPIQWRSVRLLYQQWNRYPLLHSDTCIPLYFYFGLTVTVLTVVLNQLTPAWIQQQCNKLTSQIARSETLVLQSLRLGLEEAETVHQQQTFGDEIGLEIRRLEHEQDQRTALPLSSQRYDSKEFWMSTVLRARAHVLGPCPVANWNKAMHVTLLDEDSPTVASGELPVFIRISKIGSSKNPSGSYGEVTQYRVTNLYALSFVKAGPNSEGLKEWIWGEADTPYVVDASSVPWFYKHILFNMDSICIKNTKQKSTSTNATDSSVPWSYSSNRPLPGLELVEKTALGIQTLFAAQFMANSKGITDQSPAWNRLVDIYRTEVSVLTLHNLILQIVMEGMTMDVATMRETFYPTPSSIP